jgi:hypothetical protein
MRASLINLIYLLYLREGLNLLRMKGSIGLVRFVRVLFFALKTTPVNVFAIS